MAVKTARLEGRDHLVVPTVMITAGVHEGSGGSLYYPTDQLANSVNKWNGKPVVLRHPDSQGPSGGSAGVPQVFEQQRVGTVFNTSFDGRRLKADLWLDVQRLQEISPQTLDAIKSNRMMEVSTGLFSDKVAPGGTFLGKDFYATVYNISPDHCAILPDEIGACSIKDGCGMLRNSSPGLPLPSMGYGT